MLMTPKSSWQLHGDFRINGIIVFENIEPLKEIVEYIRTVEGEGSSPKKIIELLVKIVNFKTCYAELEGYDEGHLESLMTDLEEALPIDSEEDFMPGTTVLFYPLDCSGTLAVTYFIEEF